MGGVLHDVFVASCVVVAICVAVIVVCVTHVFVAAFVTDDNISTT